MELLQGGTAIGASASIFLSWKVEAAGGIGTVKRLQGGLQDNMKSAVYCALYGDYTAGGFRAPSDQYFYDIPVPRFLYD